MSSSLSLICFLASEDTKQNGIKVFVSRFGLAVRH